jgi:hypothetical protein
MSRKYAQLVELLEAQGVMQTDQPWAEPVVAFIKSNRKTGNGQQYRESAELDTLRTANQRLEGEVARLKGQIEGLKDTIAGAGMWIRDVTDVVLLPLSREVQGGLGAEADGFGGHTPELLRSIDAALRGNGGE